MKEMPGNAEVSLIGKNPSINTIYASNDLDEEQEFIPVINAIQGEGFNPLWRQVLIVFNEGFTPHQFGCWPEIEQDNEPARLASGGVCYSFSFWTPCQYVQKICA